MPAVCQQYVSSMSAVCHHDVSSMPAACQQYVSSMSAVCQQHVSSICFLDFHSLASVFMVFTCFVMGFRCSFPFVYGVLGECIIRWPAFSCVNCAFHLVGAASVVTSDDNVIPARLLLLAALTSTLVPTLCLLQFETRSSV
jgi:fatty-acid desaturase